MGLIDELKSGAQQATAHARVTVREAELGHDLDEAYAELGREAFSLVQTGTVRERSLTPLAARVGELEASLRALRAGRGGINGLGLEGKEGLGADANARGPVQGAARSASS